MKKYYVNPEVIFYFQDQGLVASDLYLKNTYALEANYFNRLFEWYQNPPQEHTPEDQELLEARLLIPEPHSRGSWQGDDVSWLCHVATRLPAPLTPPQSDEEMCQEMMAFAASKDAAPERVTYTGDSVPLPKPDLSLLKEEDFYQVLKSRMTSRNFTNDPITLNQLSLLLFICFGYIHGQDWDDVTKSGLHTLEGERKSSPSATGLQSCEAYITAQYVEGLGKGIYRYNPKDHQLHLVRSDLKEDEFKHITCDQFWIREAACGLFIVFDSSRVFLKHEGPRALLVGYNEAGHLSQTTLLTATAMGFNTWLSATLRDDYVTEILNLESPRCHAISFIVFGHGKRDPVPAMLKERLLAQEGDQGAKDSQTED